MSEIGIVLIADRLFTDEKDTSFSSSSLEQISDEYFYDVYNSLKAISSHITHYNTPNDFIDNIQKHKNELVFTIYGGEKSRNRMALIPSICESYHIKYCGADTYSRILCQDKYLSKLYCHDFDLKSANSYLIRDSSEICLLDNLSFPLVLKPNMEGSSIGINDKSIVTNIKNAEILIRELLDTHQQPVLAEEFIEGKEICFYIIGNDKNMEMFSALEIFLKTDESYFLTHLYTADLKHKSDDQTYRFMTDKLPKQEVCKIRNIFHSLGKMDYMRIDCRLKNNELYLIELTPDAHIGADSGFGYIADNMDLSYQDVFNSIIRTSLSYYQSPTASLK